jgi:hypothetical protein
MPKIFISYSSADRFEALELFKLLEDNGCEVWMDYFDITPAQRLAEQLQSNIEMAEWVCLLMSPASVASQWVENEVNKTQSLSKKLLGIILRSCTIPNFITDIVHIDARMGLSDQNTKTRIVETVTNKRLLNEEDKLNEGKRFEIKKQEIRDNTNKYLPLIKDKFIAVDNLPIKNIELVIDKNAFPPKYVSQKVYEINFNINELFISPLRIFISAFSDKKTWPKEFKIPDPSYKDFYRNLKSRIVVQLDWCERSEEFTQVIDGTDFYDYPATFKYQFDGKELKEKRHWQNLQQKFEIETLNYLVKNKSTFKIIEHDPIAKKAQYINSNELPFYLELHALYPEEDNKIVTLFKNYYSYTEQIALTANSFKVYESDIEKTFLLTELIATMIGKEYKIDLDKKRRIVETLQMNKEVMQEEKVLASRYLYTQGIYLKFKGQNFEALKTFEKAADYLSETIFHKFPTHTDIIIFINSCEAIANLLRPDRIELIKSAMEWMVAGAEYAVHLYPEEPEYKLILEEVRKKANLI